MKFKSVLVILIGVLVYIGGIYGLLRYLAYSGAIGTADVWIKFKQWGIVGLIVLAVCSLIAWILIRYLFNRKISSNDLTTPKQPVDSDVSEKLFLQAFIKNTGIPFYTIEEDKKQIIKPFNPHDIMVKNPRTFFDEKTGQQFQRMEVEALTGTKRGISTVIIETDKGEEHIPKNWNFWIKEHYSMDTVKIERDFPISSIEDNSQRIEMLKYKILEESGASPTEMAYLDSLKPKQKPMIQEHSDENNPKNDLDTEKRRLDNIEKMERIKRLQKDNE